jgi:hypothetical protein
MTTRDDERYESCLVEIFREAMTRDLLPGLAFLIVSSMLGAMALLTIKLKVTAAQFCSSFDVAQNRQRIVPTPESLAEEGVNGAVFPELL